MTASLPQTVPLRSGPILKNPAAASQLELLAKSIRLAASPAFFAIWQDDQDSMRLFAESVVKAGLKTPHVIQPDNLAAELNRLEKRASSLSEDHGIVFLGCLTPMHEEERKQFNATRDRLLRIRTKMIFVESIADEGELRLGFPDVFSQVSFDCRLFLRDVQDAFAASDPSSQHHGDAKIEQAALLSGTVHELHETDADCWLEISPGVRVKFSVPLSLLAHLNPQPGLELLWSPGKEGESPTFTMPVLEPPDPKLLGEFEELTRRFHEDLKHRKRRLPQDISPSS